MNVAVPPLFRPPAARRNKKPLGAIGILAALARNPVEIWSDFHFEHPVLVGKTFFGYRAVVSDPAGVRRVFLDNVGQLPQGRGAASRAAAGPRQRPADRRGRGVEGAAARARASVLAAPGRLLRPRHASRRAGRRRGRRRAARRRRDRGAGGDGASSALKVLEQTLFSQGLARDATQFQKAVTRYFETIGRIDPLDVLGAPDFLPRIGRIRGKDSLAFFAAAVDDIIAARRALIASGASAPEDLLTLLLRAADPETGRGLSEEDVRANIVTFIGAGHETTANALTWTLYLLSQSPSWRARVEAEIDAKFDPADETDPTERLPVTKAVFEEAMRLFPPAANLVREAIGEDWLAGLASPPGRSCRSRPMCCTATRRYGATPTHFDPSRFLPGEREKIDRYAYIPFGAGPRVCIGQAFAMQEGADRARRICSSACGSTCSPATRSRFSSESRCGRATGCG